MSAKDRKMTIKYSALRFRHSALKLKYLILKLKFKYSALRSPASALLFSLILLGCSGQGGNTVTSGGAATNGALESETANIESETTPQTSTPVDPDAPTQNAGLLEDGLQSSGSAVTGLGDAVSHSPLTDYANSLTTGSGEVLVNLGAVVAETGNTLTHGLATYDDSMINDTGAGVSKVTTQVGSTVVATGDTIAQLDALPVFVQLNDKTGVLSYSGRTVSELGGKLEQVGDTLEFHFSDENGGLYGLSSTLSATTAPILKEVDGLLDLKGNALILFENKADIKPALGQLVYVTGSSLKEGTQALLSDKQGMVRGVGEVLVGSNGLTAVLVGDRLSNNEVLTSLQSTLGGLNASDGDQILVDTKGKLQGVIANVGEKKAIVTSNVSSLIASVTQPNSDNVLASIPVVSDVTKKLLDSNNIQDNPLSGVLAGLKEKTGALGTAPGAQAGLVDNVSDGLNGVNNTLLGSTNGPVTSGLNQTLNGVLQTQSDGEKAGLLDTIDNKILDPLLGKKL